MLVIIDVVDIRSATWLNSLTRIGQEQQHIARLDPWPDNSPSQSNRTLLGSGGKSGEAACSAW